MAPASGLGGSDMGNMADEELAQWLEVASRTYTDEGAEVIRQAAARLRELSRDGERYRALRNSECGDFGIGEFSFHVIRRLRDPDSIDAAIDQAMEKKG